MKSNESEPSVALLPAAITAVLAAIGIAGMAFVFFSADQVPATGGVGMQSADAVYRAGATITPTAPRAPSPPQSTSPPSIRVADEARQGL